MASILEIKGLARLRSRLLTHKQGMCQRLTVGLKRGGLFLQRESELIVPVDKGNLKASSFTRSEFDNTSAVTVRVGYTAAYALYVHENLDALHGAAYNQAYAKELAAPKKKGKKGQAKVKGRPMHSRGENQQAKFLERPAREKLPEMRQILRDAMMVGR